MLDFQEPVEPTFIALTIGAIFFVTAIGIILVKMKKKS